MLGNSYEHIQFYGNIFKRCFFTRHIRHKRTQATYGKHMLGRTDLLSQLEPVTRQKKMFMTAWLCMCVLPCAVAEVLSMAAGV